MYQPIILCIALRYMRRHIFNRYGNFNSWFSIIGIILGVISLIMVLSVMNGFEKEFEKQIVCFIPQAIITTKEEKLNTNFISSEFINKLDNVIHITPLVLSDVILQSSSGVTMGIMLGVHETELAYLSYYLGNQILQLIPGNYQIILGSTMANKLHVKCGETIRIIIADNEQITSLGNIPNQRLFTIAGIYSTISEIDSYHILVNQEDAAKLINYPKGYITGWRLWLDQPLMVDHINKTFIPKDLIWKDWRESHGELFQAVRIEKNIMNLFFSLIFIIAGFNIITLLSLEVMDKKNEIAIFHTQGLKPIQIMLIFITQGLIIGIIGTFLGTILGLFLTKNLNGLISIFMTLNKRIIFPIYINPIQVIMIMISSILISLISTVYPSWQAAIMHPTNILRHA